MRQRLPKSLNEAAIRRKLHAWELQHLRHHTEELRAEVERLSAECEDLKRRLTWAEDCAESWRDDALRAIEDAGAAPGLTISGHLVAIQPESRA